MAKEGKNEKRDRFERLAANRTNELLKKLKVLGNCANRSAYEYGEIDVNKIFSELEKQMRATKAKFHFPRSKGSKFKL